MLHRDLRPRRDCSPVSASVSPRGFTLAELLIVIAIIGVLISILLPTLGSARRAANSAKCLAALRDVGLAFQQYAQDNKRAFPMVEYSPPTTFITPQPGSSLRRPWTDYLVKYIHKKDPDVSATIPDMGKYKNASTLWGCPSFEQELAYSATTDPGTSVAWVGPNKWNTGYGMHRYALAPYSASYKSPAPPTAVVQAALPGTYANPVKLAIVKDPVVVGQYYKMERWGTRAAERGLIADSNSYDIIGSSTWVVANSKACDPFIPNPNNLADSYISVDGIRHIAPGASLKKTFAAKGVNMLFVDGHAAGVSPEQAWIAIRGGGVDVRQ